MASAKPSPSSSPSPAAGPGKLKESALKLLNILRQEWLAKHGIPPPPPSLTAKQRAEIEECFEMLDTDGSGAIDVDEIADSFGALGFAIDKESIEELIGQMDADGNGELGFDEFLSLMARAIYHPDENGKELVANTGTGAVSFADAVRAFRRKKLIESLIVGGAARKKVLAFHDKVQELLKAEAAELRQRAATHEIYERMETQRMEKERVAKVADPASMRARKVKARLQGVISQALGAFEQLYHDKALASSASNSLQDTPRAVADAASGSDSDMDDFNVRWASMHAGPDQGEARSGGAAAAPGPAQRAAAQGQADGTPRRRNLLGLAAANLRAAGAGGGGGGGGAPPIAASRSVSFSPAKARMGRGGGGGGGADASGSGSESEGGGGAGGNTARGGGSRAGSPRARLGLSSTFLTEAYLPPTASALKRLESFNQQHQGGHSVSSQQQQGGSGMGLGMALLRSSVGLGLVARQDTLGAGSYASNKAVLSRSMSMNTVDATVAKVSHKMSANVLRYFKHLEDEIRKQDRKYDDLARLNASFVATKPDASSFKQSVMQAGSIRPPSRVDCGGSRAASPDGRAPSPQPGHSRTPPHAGANSPLPALMAAGGGDGPQGGRPPGSPTAATSLAGQRPRPVHSHSQQGMMQQQRAPSRAGQAAGGGAPLPQRLSSPLPLPSSATAHAQLHMQAQQCLGQDAQLPFGVEHRHSFEPNVHTAAPICPDPTVAAHLHAQHQQHHASSGRALQSAGHAPAPFAANRRTPEPAWGAAGYSSAASAAAAAARSAASAAAVLTGGGGSAPRGVAMAASLPSAAPSSYASTRGLAFASATGHAQDDASLAATTRTGYAAVPFPGGPFGAGTPHGAPDFAAPPQALRFPQQQWRSHSSLDLYTPSHHAATTGGIVGAPPRAAAPTTPTAPAMAAPLLPPPGRATQKHVAPFVPRLNLHPHAPQAQGQAAAQQLAERPRADALQAWAEAAANEMAGVSVMEAKLGPPDGAIPLPMSVVQPMLLAAGDYCSDSGCGPAAIPPPKPAPPAGQGRAFSNQPAPLQVAQERSSHGGEGGAASTAAAAPGGQWAAGVPAAAQAAGFLPLPAAADASDGLVLVDMDAILRDAEDALAGQHHHAPAPGPGSIYAPPAREQQHAHAHAHARVSSAASPPPASYPSVRRISNRHLAAGSGSGAVPGSRHGARASPPPSSPGCASPNPAGAGALPPPAPWPPVATGRGSSSSSTTPQPHELQLPVGADCVASPAGRTSRAEGLPPSRVGHRLTTPPPQQQQSSGGGGGGAPRSASPIRPYSPKGAYRSLVLRTGGSGGGSPGARSPSRSAGNRPGGSLSITMGQGGKVLISVVQPAPLRQARSATAAEHNHGRTTGTAPLGLGAGSGGGLPGVSPLLHGHGHGHGHGDEQVVGPWGMAASGGHHGAGALAAPAPVA